MDASNSRRFVAVNAVSASEEHHISLEISNDAVSAKLYETTPVYTFLEIRNLGRENGAWKISVTNPQSSSITLYYNERMCNEGDAKNWTGLSHIKTVSLAAHGTGSYLIYPNFFATSVTFSYFSNGARLVTYANGLSASGGISVKTNIVH